MVIRWTRVIVIGLSSHMWVDWFKSDYRKVLEEKDLYVREVNTYCVYWRFWI